MIVTHKIKMDVQRRGMEPHLDVVCGDAYTRKLELTLYSGSEEWVVPDNVLAGVRYARADGYGGEYDTLANDEAACTIEGNVVTAILAPEVLSAPGFAEVSVVLIKAEQILGLFAVGINVKKNPSHNTVEPGKYVNWRSVFMPQTEGAKVGQYLQITKVDEVGRVIEVEPVDAPSDGGGTNEVFVKLEDGSVVSAEVEFDLSDADTPALVVSPNTAKVGQTIVVEEVDEGGKPTKWKAIDLPAGGSESGWSKLGDVIISNAYEYEMLTAENGVITIDTSTNHYDYLNSESGVRCLVIPKDITVKEQPKIIHLKVKDFTAGVFETWNADNSQPATDGFDVAKYKLSANNIANIVLENIPDRDNYKLRVTTPVINVNGLRDFFVCASMTGLSLEAFSPVNATGGGIIEIEATSCPYDERYYYQRTKVLWGKQYGGSGQETFDSIHIKPAGVGANKPKDGKVAIASYWMTFTNGTRFELWGANDA